VPHRAATSTKPLWQASRDYYFNQVAPADSRDTGDVNLTRADDLAKQASVAAKHATGFPPAAKTLARREALADKTGRSPRQIARSEGVAEVQHARLLVVPVEFNPNANDDFSGFERFDAAQGCVTEPPGTVFNGPLHNQIPNPATAGTGRDNNTLWLPDFSPDYYQQLIFSTKGVKKPVRKDLGGISLKGLTVHNYYNEVSKGRYALDGAVTGWIQVPHSEAWYTADTCEAGEKSDQGHPDNPRGTNQIAVDALNELAAQQPNFDWASYDIEDQQDLDHDGNLYEPNGVLDHVVIVHAGKDQSDGGGAQGTYALWAVSQVVDPAAGGHAIGSTGYRVFNVTFQPEDATAGVIAHEFGHDLGLPDLYDNVSGTDPDTGFWDIMSVGSRSGRLNGIQPTNMGAWSKYVLGWLNPKVLDYGSPATSVTLGQSTDPPRGSEDAVRVNLPDKVVTLGTPHSGENAWYSSQDQEWADVRLTRSIDVPAGGDVRFWAWNDYVAEELWDYGFIEVSTDGGSTWTQLEVHDEAGNVVSTDADPNGRLHDYGDLENGITGDSGGYQHQWVDLTPYAGESIQLRLRYATDAAFQERGWFADDFSVTADGTEVFSDDVESGDNGWTPFAGSFTGTRGKGWLRTSGTFHFEQYYLAEYRTFSGFDEGLRWAYATNFSANGERSVSFTKYNAPGMLIWYRDSRYTQNDIADHLFDPPSVGSKGTVLIVDSHFDPEHYRGDAAQINPSLLDALPARQQAADAAFGPVGRYPYRACISRDPVQYYLLACNTFFPVRPVTGFTDARGWYPGFEYRPDLNPANPLFFRDADASVNVPSKDDAIYSTRITDGRGNPLPDLFGSALGGGHVFGTGNPADGLPAGDDGTPGTSEDLSLGVILRFFNLERGGKAARIFVRPGHPAS
jgi:immune inhibitor A